MLTRVFLNTNYCIYEDFREPSRIKILPQVVTENCGFDEVLADDDPLEKLFNVTCGSVSYSSGLVIGGNETEPGQWPFLVSLHHLRERYFFCGGSLITSQHVLTGDCANFKLVSLIWLRTMFTAAHCIQYKNQRFLLTARELIVFLGRYKLGDSGDPNAVNSTVDKIHVHPDWNFSSESWDADLALLVLPKSVKFTSYIQPVCLPADDNVEDYNEGTVVSKRKTVSQLWT